MGVFFVKVNFLFWYNEDVGVGGSMITKYVHPRLGIEVTAPAGYYVPVQEDILQYKGKGVLYVVGNGCIETSCCGKGNWSYVQVPGFIAQEHLNGEDLDSPVSEIETIQDEVDRAEITKLLQDKYPYARIEIG
jgi:hypothetical protein